MRDAYDYRRIWNALDGRRNVELGRALGYSESGMRKILARLRAWGLAEQRGWGWHKVGQFDAGDVERRLSHGL